MTSQPELNLDTAPPDASVEAMIAVLNSETIWLTAAELLTRMGEKPTDSNKRKLRDLANQSQGQIISGQKGYKHIRHATNEEIMHASNWLEHQAKEMGERAKAIRRTYHQLIHTPK